MFWNAPVSRRVALALPLLAAACARDASPRRTSFPPLRYDYLAKLRLNVADISIDEAAPPPPGTLEALAPARPAVVVREMARDRLMPAGASGRAVFTVDEALLTRTPAGYDGSMAVHLDVLTETGVQAGFAEARVSRRWSGNGRSEDVRGVLYDLTRDMMGDMNVELEFQIRRALREWLQETSVVPAPQPVEREELSGPRT